MFRLIFTIISCFILIYSCIKSIDNTITEDEITAVGTGFEVFYNLGVQEKFAIMQPPLSGIISYSILKGFHQLNNIAVIPSGHYFGLVSFMFAIETPKMIGNEIISAIGKQNFKIIRYINILWVVLILYIISRRNVLLGGVLAIFLYPLNDIIITSTVQVLSVLLVIIILELMNSIKESVSYLKLILLGIVIGLLLAVYGSDGILLVGIIIISQVISRDIEKKKLSKGFKKALIIRGFITFLSAIFIVWICYGMDLACFCQLQSLMGFEPTNSIRIVPFFDSIKQFFFEILFPMHDHKYSFFENISRFFNMYNIIITALSLLMMLKIGNLHNQYGIFSIILIVAVCIYNDSNPVKIEIFFQTTTIILTVMTIL